MPYRAFDTSEKRFGFTGLLTEAEIEDLALSKKLQVLQFSEPVDPANWPRLEQRLFRRRPDVALRVFAFHSSGPCDLSFLRALPSLHRFHADSLMQVSSLESLAALSFLRELAIGVFELSDLRFLDKLSNTIERLSLGETRKRNLSLESLLRFSRLRELTIVGHTKDLCQVAHLGLIEKLRLRMLKSPDISFVASLPRLWWLHFVLGASDDLSAIAGVRELKYLEISWVRRLADVSFISQCTELRRLNLNRLKQVRQLPNFNSLRKLRTLKLETMKGLQSVDPIRAAPNLEWFGFADASNFQPEDFKLALRAPSLKGANVYFGSDLRNRRFTDIAAELGVRTDMTSEFREDE